MHSNCKLTRPPDSKENVFPRFLVLSPYQSSNPVLSTYVRELDGTTITYAVENINHSITFPGTIDVDSIGLTEFDKKRSSTSCFSYENEIFKGVS